MNDFDELLDEVLREDAAAAPRGGFEARVAARVRGERRRRFGFGEWLVPAAVCAGVVAAMWLVPRRVERVAPVSSVASVSSAAVSSPGVAGARESLVEGEGRVDSGRSGRALRDAHLSRDEAAAKMGHPAELPKREVFPSPAPVDMFPRPVEVNEEGRQMEELGSQKMGEALLGLREEQNQPIQIAAIKITPLQ